jgi:hypothetical protein
MNTFALGLRICAVVAWSPLLLGCASVSVKQESWAKGKITLPSKIYVADFAAPAEVLKVDREGAELEAFRAELAENFSANLREEISAGIAPAEPLLAATRPEKGSWVVEGSFLRVNQGSRLLRSLIGLGAGGTKIETRTSIAEVLRGGGRRPLGEIETTGGSNAEPGALVLPLPVGSAVRLVLSATLTGVTRDLRRTARTITALMAEKLQSQGMVLPGQNEQVKRLGGPAGSRGASGAVEPAEPRPAAVTSPGIRVGS